MSEWHERQNELEALRCKACYGSGKCDDAEPGDISFREWTCAACHGSGFANATIYGLNKLYKIVPKEAK